MALTGIEIIALVVIVFALVKMLVLLVKPKAWMSFARGIYKKPAVTSLIALILAGVVLYFLVQGGMTIIQILAVTGFVALLLAVGLAPEVPYLLKKYSGMINSGKLWQKYWLYTLIWLALVVFGIVALV